MLNKSYLLSRYKADSGKNEEKCLIHFDPDARVFMLSNEHKIQLCDKFFSVICIYLTPFSQLQFGLISCMILMKEYVSLATAIMKMGTVHFYSDHRCFIGKFHDKSFRVCHLYITDFLEIFTSSRYHRDMKILKILASNSKRFRVYEQCLMDTSSTLHMNLIVKKSLRFYVPLF